MTPSNLLKVSDEVFVAQDSIVTIGPTEIEILKRTASTSPRQRARICAHKDHSDAIQEMVICISRESYIRPHRHMSKSESFHVIQGAADVVIFDDEGRITDIVELGDETTRRAFFYRLPAGTYHTLLIKTDFFLVHEVTNGPFRVADAQLAPWSPSEEIVEDVLDYVEKLKKEVDARGNTAPFRH